MSLAPRPADPAAVPAPLRRPAVVAVGTAAAVLAVLAVRYAGRTTAGQVDDRIEPLVDSVSGPHWVLRQAVTLGSPPSVVLLGVGLAALCLVLGRRWLALLALVGPGLTGVATVALKPTIGRTLDGAYAFPSGHTGGATAIGLVVALLVVSLVRAGRAAGVAVLAGCALLAGGGVGVAMVAANYHYPTDILGGFCTAVIAVLGSALLIEWFAERRDRRTAGS